MLPPGLQGRTVRPPPGVPGLQAASSRGPFSPLSVYEHGRHQTQGATGPPEWQPRVQLPDLFPPAKSRLLLGPSSGLRGRLLRGHCLVRPRLTRVAQQRSRMWPRRAAQAGGDQRRLRTAPATRRRSDAAGPGARVRGLEGPASSPTPGAHVHRTAVERTKPSARPSLTPSRAQGMFAECCAGAQGPARPAAAMGGRASAATGGTAAAATALASGPRDARACSGPAAERGGPASRSAVPTPGRRRTRPLRGPAGGRQRLRHRRAQLRVSGRCTGPGTARHGDTIARGARGPAAPRAAALTPGGLWHGRACPASPPVSDASHAPWASPGARPTGRGAGRRGAKEDARSCVARAAGPTPRPSVSGICSFSS